MVTIMRPSSSTQSPLFELVLHEQRHEHAHEHIVHLLSTRDRSRSIVILDSAPKTAYSNDPSRLERPKSLEFHVFWRKIWMWVAVASADRCCSSLQRGASDPGYPQPPSSKWMAGVFAFNHRESAAGLQRTMYLDKVNGARLQMPLQRINIATRPWP